MSYNAIVDEACYFSWQVLTSLASSVFPATITFLKSDCTTSLLNNSGHVTKAANQSGYGVQEVTSFLRIISAILDRNFQREDMEKVYATELNGKLNVKTFCQNGRLKHKCSNPGSIILTRFVLVSVLLVSLFRTLS